MYFKKAFIDFPKLILISLAVSIVAYLIFFITSKIYSEDVSKINVAYVIDEEDASFRSAIKYLTKSVNCKLKPYTKEEALNDLHNKKVAAVLLIDNCGEDGQKKDMSETTIEFIYPDSEEFLSSIFGDVIRAGLSDYIVVRNSAKTVQEIYPGYDKESLEKLKDNLMDILVDRNKNYERKIYTDTGDVPLSMFYAGSAISMIIMLSAGVLIGFMKRDDRMFLLGARRKNITSLDIIIARYIPVICMYVALSIIVFTIYQILYIGEISISELSASLLATIVLVMSIIFIYEIINDSTLGVVCCVAFTIIELFISGSIIPSSYLPETISKAGNFFVVKWTTRAYGQLLFGIRNERTLVCLLWANVFVTIIICILLAIRKENTVDGTN